LSPEQILLEQNPLQVISEKVDIFALGLILLELNCNLKTFSEKVFCFDSLKEKGKLPSGYGLESLVEGNIITALTKVDPSERPSALEIKSHWLAQWNKDVSGSK